MFGVVSTPHSMPKSFGFPSGNSTITLKLVAITSRSGNPTRMEMKNMERDENEELGCGCGFLWGQFMDAGIDESVFYCPCCGREV